MPSLSSSAVFQSTHPVRGATTGSRDCRAAPKNFNPRTPCGVRQSSPARISGRRAFQSTHPVRGATGVHAFLIQQRGISIHAPRAGCDDRQPRLPGSPKKFQSTHPVRGATAETATAIGIDLISIHAPRAGCDYMGVCSYTPVHVISIHAPRAGCDCSSIVVILVPLFISIHAPRAGCDGSTSQSSDGLFHFNPRTPCGVRQTTTYTTRHNRRFQSTHPVRGATIAREQSNRARAQFQSTHPVRGATRHEKGLYVHKMISIHAPRAGCDDAKYHWTIEQLAFQSTHPVRGATANLTVLPGQICAKGTKKSLFSRKNAQKRK